MIIVDGSLKENLDKTDNDVVKIYSVYHLKSLRTYLIFTVEIKSYCFSPFREKP